MIKILFILINLSLAEECRKNIYVEKTITEFMIQMNKKKIIDKIVIQENISIDCSFYHKIKEGDIFSVPETKRLKGFFLIPQMSIQRTQYKVLKK